MDDFSLGAPDDSARDLVAGWNPAEEPLSVPDFVVAPPSWRGEALPASDGIIEAGRHWARVDSEARDEGRLIRAFRLAPEPASLSEFVAGGPDDEGPAPWAGRGPRGVGPQRSLGFVPPRRGDEIAGFQILSELGRGAFARVYLARQKDLGDRLVALKVSRAEGDEPQILAKLQHTHIVPIHSVHDDRRTGLRLLCMPYLGGANLAQVIEATGAKLPQEVTGRSLVEALDVVSNRLHSGAAHGPEPRPLPGSLPPSPAASHLPTIGRRAGPDRPRPVSISRLHSLWAHIPWRRTAEPDGPGEEAEAEPMQPARRFLREADHIRASVWIIARLAEGLDHAHSRGLLHRDLKPSNILIAADGTPMLLDFNLSAPKRMAGPEDGVRAHIGGTLPYMSPEHLDAFNPKGTTSAEAVDERSDLYALGLILYEMVAGRYPFAEPPPGTPMPEVIRLMLEQRAKRPSLRADCPEAPWSLDAVVARCLDPDPARRYARARDLAEDLRRFLDDLPMRHASEPSPRERLAKWARRNPRACSSSSVALMAAALLIGLGGLMGLLASNLRLVSARLRLQVFQAQFEDCQFLLNTASGTLDHLRRGVDLAGRAIDQMGLDSAGGWASESWVRRLSGSEQLELRERASELLQLEARGRAVLAENLGSEADRRAALERAVVWLDRAERLDPRPPAALFETRALFLAKLGVADRAASDRLRAAQTPLASSRDFALRGTSRLARADFRGAEADLRDAEADLRRAVGLDPRSFWAWFALGHCHFEQGRYLEAAGDFGACTALGPRFAWPHLNRGLALARAGRLVEAQDAYDRALSADPQFVEARVDRALARLEINDLEGADADLGRAVALGRDDATVLAILGEVKARLGRRDEAERIYDRLLRERPGRPDYLVARAFFRLRDDPAGARADLDRALAVDPRNARAHYGRALLLRASRPDEALEQVQAAIDADANLIDAVQLRALLRAGRGDPSAKDDVERLVAAPTAHRLYNAACALSVLSETSHDPPSAARAVGLLDRALDAGFPAAEAADDPDLRPIRARREYLEALRRHGHPRSSGRPARADTSTR